MLAWQAPFLLDSLLSPVVYILTSSVISILALRVGVMKQSVYYKPILCVRVTVAKWITFGRVKSTLRNVRKRTKTLSPF